MLFRSPRWINIPKAVGSVVYSTRSPALHSPRPQLLGTPIMYVNICCGGVILFYNSNLWILYCSYLVQSTEWVASLKWPGFRLSCADPFSGAFTGVGGGLPWIPKTPCPRSSKSKLATGCIYSVIVPPWIVIFLNDSKLVMYRAVSLISN